MVHALLRMLSVPIVALIVLSSTNDNGVPQNATNQCVEIEPFVRTLSWAHKNERDSAKQRLLDFSERSLASRQCLIAALLKIATVSDGGAQFIKSPERFREWSEATDLLGRIQATEALDVLISCLDCNDGKFGLSLGRFPAALAVLRFGESAIAKLSAALNHKNPAIRHKAAEVLHALGGDEAKREVKKARLHERVRWIADSMENMLRTWHDMRTVTPN